MAASNDGPFKAGEHRYYILALDVRTDELDCYITDGTYTPTEMVAIRNRVKNDKPFCIVMCRPYNAESKQALQVFLSQVKVKGKLPD